MTVSMRWWKLIIVFAFMQIFVIKFILVEFCPKQVSSIVLKFSFYRDLCISTLIFRTRIIKAL